jgi:dTDP-4-dehydrorhamnose reductase
MADQGKFLLLGGSGLLGRHMRRLLDPRQTVATYRSHPVEGAIFFDAASARLRDTLLRGEHGFSAAFILYGITKLDDCARDPEGTARVNVASIKQVIDDLCAAGIKTIFASSDAVFDGASGLKRESDPVNPVMVYGKQKLEIERYLEATGGAWAIARLSKLVSVRPEPRNLLNEWADQIERGEAIRCAKDLVFSPADADDAAAALIRMAEDSFSGLYNVCGPEALGRLELLDTLVRQIRERKRVQPRVEVCSARDLKFMEPRPLDVSMDPSRLYGALGSRFRSMDSVCAEFVVNWCDRAVSQRVGA